MSPDLKSRRQELFRLRDAAAAKGHHELALFYNQQAADLAIESCKQDAGKLTDLVKPATRH